MYILLIVIIMKYILIFYNYYKHIILLVAWVELHNIMKAVHMG